MQVILIHLFNIFYLKNFFFQPNNVDFALLVYLIDINVIGLFIEKNTYKPIFIF